MAGIANSGVVDLIAQDASGNPWLIMIEDRRWGADENQETQLRGKVNAYADYIISGSLAQQYPETAGRRVGIRLECVDTPRGPFRQLVERTASLLAERGIDFYVNPID